MPAHRVERHRASWRPQVDPGLGGSLWGWWLDKTPVLRPMPENAMRADQGAADRLGQHLNRMGQGRMDWCNGFNGEAHALHRVGYLRLRTVLEQQDAT